MNRQRIDVLLIVAALFMVARPAVGQHGHEGHEHEGHGHAGHEHAGHEPQAGHDAAHMPSPPEMEAMMKEWVRVMTPSDHHKRLDYFVGKWEMTTRMWWGGPAAPPIETKGKCETRWVLGGRFLLDEVKSEVMWPGKDGRPEPRPFEGLGMTGYDNYRQMYVANWADTMGTHLLAMKGTLSRDGKVFTYYGEMDEPGLAIGRYVKYVTSIVDQSAFVFTIYDLHAGEDYKVMEITYKRQ